MAAITESSTDPSDTIVEKKEHIYHLLPHTLTHQDGGKELRECVDMAVRDLKHILLDFKNNTFLDSSAIGILVSGHQKLDGIGKHLAACNVSEEMRDLFSVASVDGFLEMYATREDVPYK